MMLLKTKISAVFTAGLLAISLIFAPLTAQSAEQDNQTVNLTTISDVKRLELAQFLLKNNQADKAILAISFKKFSTKQHVIIAENILADALFAVGKKTQAIVVMRNLLAADPNLTMSRYKLAQMLFATEDDLAAKHHFKILRNSLNGDNAQIVISKYLKQIDLRKRWFFNVGGNVIPQSNFNGGSGNNVYFCEDTASTPEGIASWTQLLAGFNLDCTVGIPIAEAEQAQNGVVVSANISGGYRFRLSENASWTVRASGEYTRYPNNITPDTLELAMNMGPTIALSRATKLNIDGRASITISNSTITKKRYAISATFDHVFNPQISGSVTTSLSKTDNISNADYSNLTASLNASTQISLDNSSYIRLLGGVSRGQYDEPNLSFWQVSTGLGYYKEFEQGITIYSELGLAYKAKPLEAVTTLNFNTKLTKRDFSFMGFTPQLVYNYNFANSNINRNDTDAHTISIGITRSF